MRKSIVLIILSVFLVMSCKPMCNVGKNAAGTIANSMQSRWKCDYQTTYDYFSKPVKDYICKDESKYTMPPALFGALCQITAKILSAYTAQVISTKFKCDFQLVNKDLQMSGNVCAILYPLLFK